MWVSAWCLSSGTRSVSNRTQRDCGGDKSTSQFIEMLTWGSQLRVEGSRVHKDRAKPSEGWGGCSSLADRSARCTVLRRCFRGSSGARSAIIAGMWPCSGSSTADSRSLLRQRLGDGGRRHHAVGGINVHGIYTSYFPSLGTYHISVGCCSGSRRRGARSFAPNCLCHGVLFTFR